MSKTRRTSFRMPNSLVQGLTTTTSAALNRLTSTQMIVLFGLVSLVDQKRPAEEVRVRISRILDIVRVGRAVQHAVERTWTTANGQKRTKLYACKRVSPRQLADVRAAMLSLFQQYVVVRTRCPKTNVYIERVTHILDSFGFVYQTKAGVLDIFSLPDSQRNNVGTDDRPVFRLRDKTPCAVSFRLSSELAPEITGQRGSIHFTVVAHRVFDLFRELTRWPAAIRLLVLILRQTNHEFHRPLEKLLADLGGDTSHRSRSTTQLLAALEELKRLGVVNKFQVSDTVTIRRDAEWHKATPRDSDEHAVVGDA